MWPLLFSCYLMRRKWACATFLQFHTFKDFLLALLKKMSKVLLVSVQQRKNLNHLFKNLLSLAEVLSPIQSHLFESHYWTKKNLFQVDNSLTDWVNNLHFLLSYASLQWALKTFHRFQHAETTAHRLTIKPVSNVMQKRWINFSHT